MTCQDCIHHNVCYYAGRLKTKDSDGEKRIIAETNNVEDTCENFSDRSEWVKLPSENYTFTIRGDLARGIIVANCRTAEEAERALKERESNER